MTNFFNLIASMFPLFQNGWFLLVCGAFILLLITVVIYGIVMRVFE